jgi:diamine N-acetyltransferase
LGFNTRLLINSIEPSQKISIKKAHLSDAPVISFLGRQTFSETFSGLFTHHDLNEYLNATFGIRKLEASLSKNENIFGIIFYSEKPVGYYKIKLGFDYNHKADDKFIQLQKIYILKSHLHLKLGRLMMDHIFSQKEIADCETTWLVVLNTNYRAIKFYGNQGFKKLKKYHYTIGKQRLEYDLMVRPNSGLLF